MRMKKLLGVVVAAVVLRSGAASAYEADERQRPDQNWTAEQSHWFHHAGQGTFILPYHWFLALERPTLRLFGTVPLFREEDNLARFGFLPSPTDPRYNPDGLPIGFAKDRVRDPDTGDEVEVVGLTCAACHTSEIQYRGEKILVDGGSAMIDVTAFQRELGLAVGYTAKVPFRFGRFAARVLGDGATAEAEAELRKRFDAVLASGVGEKRVAEARRLYEVPGGFTRTDALGRIGNLVFGLQLDEENLRVADAPVNYPPLWDASWFDWVQYNASIQQPMARNIGEALGVRARIDLKGRDEELYRSTVNVRNLYEMEKLLSGPEPFEGLRAPKWPEDILGEIDRQKAARGKRLYADLHCRGCHMPPVDSPELRDQRSKYWTRTNRYGKRFLKVSVINLAAIGTDPTAAVNWYQRVAETNDLGLGTVGAGEALEAVTTHVAERAYDELRLSESERAEWNGYRDPAVRAPLGYKARPLDGIWATGPYLHNASVRSLYELLLPASERARSFSLGSREFDPREVGFVSARNGAWTLRTDEPGNSNAGHEFRDAPIGAGVIGRELTDDERWDLVEYLKTL